MVPGLKKKIIFLSEQENECSFTSVSRSGSVGRTNHLNAAHKLSGTKQTYIMMVVAAIETKWKL